MSAIHPILILLLFIVGLLSVMIIWGLWRAQKEQLNKHLMDTDDNNLQLGFLALAIFALGVLVAYILFIFIPAGA